MRNYYDELIDAISEYDISAICSVLQGSVTFTAEEIYNLCADAMTVQCEREIILEIMKHGPSVEELLAYDPNISLIPGQSSGFMELVTRYDRSDLLHHLLEQGSSPNRRHENRSSPLEVALHFNAPHCVCELLHHPALDTSITEQMRRSWGRLGMEIPRGFSALREIAAALFTLDPGKLTSYSDIPLLPGMTFMHAARNRNWSLLGRICAANGITEEQCNAILENFEAQYCEKQLNCPSAAADALQDITKLLDTLFTVCPGLLESEYPRSLLTICMLQWNDETSAILMPLRRWWEQMSGGGIVLKTIGHGPWAELLTDGMQHWNQCIGSHRTPILLRSNPLPFTKSFWIETDAMIHNIIPKCQISGEIPEHGLSPLAQSLITCYSQEHSEVVNAVLAPEDPSAVRSFRQKIFARINELKRELSRYQ